MAVSKSTPKPLPEMMSLHEATEEMRWRILNQLGDGPLSAAEMAEKLGTTPQHCNWHLGRLEKAGLVAVSLQHPSGGGMKVKVFSLVAREWTVRVTSKGAQIVSKPLKA